MDVLQQAVSILEEQTGLNEKVAAALTMIDRELKQHGDAIAMIERNIKNLETMVRSRTDHLA